jgi:hypothetical protein
MASPPVGFLKSTAHGGMIAISAFGTYTSSGCPDWALGSHLVGGRASLEGVSENGSAGSVAPAS